MDQAHDGTDSSKLKSYDLNYLKKIITTLIDDIRSGKFITETKAITKLRMAINNRENAELRDTYIRKLLKGEIKANSQRTSLIEPILKYYKEEYIKKSRDNNSETYLSIVDELVRLINKRKLSEAKKLYEETKFVEDEISQELFNLEWIGITLHIYHDFSNRIEQLDNIITILKRENIIDHLTRTYLYKIKLCIALGRIDEAENCFHQAVRQFSNDEISLFDFKLLIAEGIILGKRTEYEKSEKLLEFVIDKTRFLMSNFPLQKEAIQSVMSVAFLENAKICIERGILQEAKSNIQNALLHSSKYTLGAQEILYYQNLIEFYLGNFQIIESIEEAKKIAWAFYDTYFYALCSVLQVKCFIKLGRSSKEIYGFITEDVEFIFWETQLYSSRVVYYFELLKHYIDFPNHIEEVLGIISIIKKLCQDHKIDDPILRYENIISTYLSIYGNDESQNKQFYDRINNFSKFASDEVNRAIHEDIVTLVKEGERDYYEILDVLKRNIRLYERKNNQKAIVYTLVHLALIHLEYKKVTESKEVWERILSLTEGTFELKIRAQALLSLGYIYLDFLKEGNKALPYLEEYQYMRTKYKIFEFEDVSKIIEEVKNI